MSAEIPTTTGESKRWEESYRGEEKFFINVGEYTFDKSEFYIGMLEFLAGRKIITVGEVTMVIPDFPNGVVGFGDYAFPYHGFVTGAIWSLKQTGGSRYNFQRSQQTIFIHALDKLEEQLKKEVPKQDFSLLERAIFQRELLARSRGPIPAQGANNL